MLRIRVKAPFAAFRPFAAGSYRPTAPFLTPSAAYGLLLNIAGIESRWDDGVSLMTLTRPDLPTVEVAVGAVRLPEVQSLLQQLHNYPVGSSRQAWAEQTKGNKYNIQPVRRELLSDLDAYIGLRGNDALEHQVREGLRLGSAYSPQGEPRYGLPFAGDNNFLLSILREEFSPIEAHWFVRSSPATRAVQDQVRLTVWINRQDQSQTVSLPFNRAAEKTLEIPENAWIKIPPT